MQQFEQILTLILNHKELIATLIVTLLTHHMAERLRANPRVSSGLEKLAGVFLIGFGIKLALSK